MGYLGHKASSGWVCNFGERVMIVCFAFYWSRSLRSQLSLPFSWLSNTGPPGRLLTVAPALRSPSNSLLCIAGYTGACSKPPANLTWFSRQSPDGEKRGPAFFTHLLSFYHFLPGLLPQDVLLRLISAFTLARLGKYEIWNCFTWSALCDHGKELP